MPIKDLSDAIRLPRLGKIHLGTKHPEKGYPVKTDYFVFDKENPLYGNLVKVFGDKPKELRILIPTEDEGTWAEQYYRSYDMTHGLICKGDGEEALRMVDIATEDIATPKTKTVALRPLACEGKQCPVYQAKKCHERMQLRFLLPEIPGLGIWQIDTGSINSIMNINSSAALIRSAFKRLSLIPLLLRLEPQEVNNPESGKRQTVYILNLRTNITIMELAEKARQQSQTLRLEMPDVDELWDSVAGETETLPSTKSPIEKATAKPAASPETQANGAPTAQAATTTAETTGKDEIFPPETSQKKPRRAAGVIGAEDIKNLGDLKTYLFQHGKQYDTAWLIKTSGQTEADMQTPTGLAKAIADVKQLTGW